MTSSSQLVPLVIKLLYLIMKSFQHAKIDCDSSIKITVCGWMLAAVCLGLVPLCAVHSIMTRKGSTFIEVSCFKYKNLK